jgi:hypothetical protein
MLIVPKSLLDGEGRTAGRTGNGFAFAQGAQLAASRPQQRRKHKRREQISDHDFHNALLLVSAHQ